MNESKFKFIDLFAGIGGMRIGFENAGGQCILTCEINNDAMVTYKANFNATKKHVYAKNILELSCFDVPEHDVLVAGFPCQPYSIAGLRKGLEDTRGGDIFSAIIRILKDKSPNAFLLENVKGIINHDDGKTFQYMINQLSACGYFIKYEILNSMEYANIPQNRERVFMVGFKEKSLYEQFNFPHKIKLIKTIHDCLESIKVGDEFYYTERFNCYQEIKNSIKSKNSIYQWRRQYVRENKSNACPTLTANMGSGGHNVPLILDDFGIRKLTPREIANFQGFPQSFVFPKIANSKLYHQFGNSVTVPLIERIAKEISNIL